MAIQPAHGTLVLLTEKDAGRLYAPTPAVFGVLIDAIDDTLRNAATALEMQKPGSGLHHVLDALRDHLPTTRTSSVLTALPIASSCDQATREPQR
jgi:hypothetical protein